MKDRSINRRGGTGMLTIIMLCVCFLVGGVSRGQTTSAGRQSTSAPKRLPDGRVGEPFEYLVAVQGLVEPLQYRWSGSIPKGLQTAGARLWGSPEQTLLEPALFTVTIVDAINTTLQQHYALSIRPSLQPLQMASNGIPTFVIGQAVRYELTANGGEGAYHWQVNDSVMPSGLSLELGVGGNRCVLVGTPKQTGDIRLTISVNDERSRVGPVTLAGRVGPAIAPALQIGTTSLAPAQYQVAYSQPLVALGGLPPYAWSMTAEGAQSKDWLYLDPTNGVIKAMPTRLGTTRVKVAVVDSLGDRAERGDLELQIEAPANASLDIHPKTLAQPVIGRPYAVEIAALGSHGHVRWKVSGLPAWLKQEPAGASLALTGTPLSHDQIAFSVSAEDLEVNDGSGQSNPVVISSATLVHYQFEPVEPKPAIQPLRILTQSLPVALVGTPYRVQLAAIGGEGQIGFQATNAMWLRLDAKGEITGTPDSPGEGVVHAKAVDAKGNSSAVVPLPFAVVAAGATEMKAADVPALFAIKGRHFSFEFPMIGGLRPYETKLEGALPSGLSYDPNSNRLSGTATAIGQFNLKLTAHDASPSQIMIQKQFSLSVLSEPRWDSFNIILVGVAVLCAIGAIASIVRMIKQGRHFAQTTSRQRKR